MLFDAPPPVPDADTAEDANEGDEDRRGSAVENGTAAETTQEITVARPPAPATDAVAAPPASSKPIFVGHGKNVVPLQKLEALLSTFQIPFKQISGVRFRRR